MLDSLVRVSRRVGGATDLLATEIRPASVRCSLYETVPIPVGLTAQQAELEHKAQTSSAAAVRSQRFVA